MSKKVIVSFLVPLLMFQAFAYAVSYQDGQEKSWKNGQEKSWSCEVYCGFVHTVCGTGSVVYSAKFMEPTRYNGCLRFTDTKGEWFHSRGKSLGGAWRGLKTHCSAIYRDYALLTNHTQDFSVNTSIATPSNSCGEK